MGREHEKEVERGIQTLFDSHHFPYWPSKIRTEDLNMRDAEKCILAQLYGSYMRGVGELYREDRYGRGYLEWAMGNGFTLDSPYSHLWDALTREWKLQLGELQSEHYYRENTSSL